MGYWKDVHLTMQSGISQSIAECIVSKERYGTKEDKEKAKIEEAIALADIKLNSMT